MNNIYRQIRRNVGKVVRAALRPPKMGISPLKKWPSFIIIGGQKCGTSSLHHILCKHPNIRMADKKEVHYFDNNYEKGPIWYRSHFPIALGATDWVTCEASPYYMFYPHTAARIAQLLPDVKLIALLRNPIDRAYSHYFHELKYKHETLETFEEALAAEESRMASELDKLLADGTYSSFAHKNLAYLTKGIYLDQLLRFTEHFSREQLLVLKSEDFFEHPDQVYAETLSFLGLPNWQPESFPIVNAQSYHEANPETLASLNAFFAPHNERLYAFLDRDLGW